MIGAIYTFVMVLLEVGTTGDQQARSLCLVSGATN